MNTTYFHISCHRVPLEPHSEQTSIPALSHFVLLGFNPENFEKIFNSRINSIIEFLSLRKKVVSSA